jgi:hypothetical protein
MPSVIFHASGSNFDLESLSGTRLKPYDIHYRGQKANRGRKDFVYEDSGFSIDLGPDDSDNLSTQIEAAIKFIDEHYHTIQSFTGLDDLRFDFGYAPRKDQKGYISLVQCDYLPPAFLKKCGELGIGLELSLYTPLKDENTEEA